MDFIRKKVAGKRVRLKEEKYDLDLTYITPRIVAMSYPAEKLLQKIYRNDITTVSNYLKEKHQDNYWVYNLSGIGYDTTPFNKKCSIHQWKDHHSPALVLLAELC
jgi:phosphatidylinositol-3,4,5-trisphosphate 3-phosphatase/dual-specificity protein phosphatase PTEN